MLTRCQYSRVLGEILEGLQVLASVLWRSDYAPPFFLSLVFPAEYDFGTTGHEPYNCGGEGMHFINRFMKVCCSTAVVAALGVGFVGAGSASAASRYASSGSTSTRAVLHVRTPVGTWDFDGPGGVVWTFSSGGGWTDGSNTGTWIQQGSEISIDIQSGGGVGCFFLGKLHKKTINTAKAPGPYACGGTSYTWYATKA